MLLVIVVVMVLVQTVLLVMSYGSSGNRSLVAGVVLVDGGGSVHCVHCRTIECRANRLGSVGEKDINKLLKISAAKNTHSISVILMVDVSGVESE